MTIETNSIPEPEIIFTHESDLDGFVSGILLKYLARKLFNKDVALKAYHYGAWENFEIRHKQAWISDLSFEARFDRKGWMIVDHHSYTHNPEAATMVHDAGKSAGMLAYELCKAHGIQSEALDRIAHYNNVSDLFLKDDPEFEVSTDYASIIKVYGFWPIYSILEGRLENLLDHPLLRIVSLKREIENPIGFDWSSRNIIEISPQVALVKTTIGNVNLIIDRMLDERTTPHQVLMTLGRRNNGPMTVSLRSRNGEALPVARMLQGGGHPNACGASLPKIIHHQNDAVEFLRNTLNPPVEETQPMDVDDLFKAIDS
jgi:oligoribonuclease NrnB/cAMP/cGMP phosphodiesterase (DHH superfamily)